MVELHNNGHPGITRMKGIARRIVWWPGIDQYLENKVKAVYSVSFISHFQQMHL